MTSTTRRPQGREDFRSLRGLLLSLRAVWEAQPLLTILLGLTTIGQSGLPAASAWAGKLVVDSVSHVLDSTQSSWSQIGHALLLAAGVALASLVLGSVSQVAEDQLREKLTRRIGTMVMKKALTLDIEFFETTANQDMLQQASMEVGFRPLGILRSAFELVKGAITLASIAVLLIHWRPWVLLLILATGAPAFYVQSKFSRESFELQRGRTSLSRKLLYYGMLLTHNWFVKETRLFGIDRYILGKYEELSSQFATENERLARRRTISASGIQLIGLLGHYAAYIAVIADALGGRLTIGDLTMYSALLVQAPTIVTSLVQTIAGLNENNLFLTNLFKYLAAHPRMNSGLSTGLLAPARLKRGLEFRDVSFSYPGVTDNVLEGVNLIVRPGERIAIVGNNGAGKTTLMKLLARLYDPTSGCIMLDGVDLRDYRLESLRSRISVIFQDFVRYQLTARENIGFGNLDELENEECIEVAAKKAGAHEVIDALPHRYDTVLGRWFAAPGEQNGVELSIGQWQKVALARAFMRNAPILVLDEPTASLDARAECELFQRLRSLAPDRVVLLISHRFSTVRMADRIVVLHRGRIVEEGSHAELLALGGQYAAMFDLQTQDHGY